MNTMKIQLLTFDEQRSTLAQMLSRTANLPCHFTEILHRLKNSIRS